MKKILLLLLLATTLVLPQSLCKVYVLSEGGFSPGSSMLSMLNYSTMQFSQNIFNPNNIGLYPDGIVYHENHLYILEQGNFGAAGKIYKLDTNGTVLNSKVVGTNPYSLAIANNKIYITNGPVSNVTVLNLSDFSEVKNINVGVYPQEIISLGNYVFVNNNSVWGGTVDSTISVIDVNSDSVVKTIGTGNDSVYFSVSNDNKLLAGVYGDAQTGKIMKINPVTLEIESQFQIPNHGFGRDLYADKNSDKIHFISYNNDVVSFNQTNESATVVVPSVFPNNYFYGYGFDFINKKHYVLDAKSFIVNGSLSIYSENGSLESSYTTGNVPRRVLFKYISSPSNTEDISLEKSYNLSQNFPNPFNPSTIISYQIPANSLVSLKLYDILGNQVADLINEYKEAGVYNYEMRVKDYELSSGVYIYELRAGSYVSSKKMVVLK